MLVEFINCPRVQRNARYGIDGRSKKPWVLLISPVQSAKVARSVFDSVLLICFAWNETTTRKAILIPWREKKKKNEKKSMTKSSSGKVFLKEFPRAIDCRAKKHCANKSLFKLFSLLIIISYLENGALVVLIIFLTPIHPRSRFPPIFFSFIKWMTLFETQKKNRLFIGKHSVEVVWLQAVSPQSDFRIEENSFVFFLAKAHVNKYEN